MGRLVEVEVEVVASIQYPVTSILFHKFARVMKNSTKEMDDRISDMFCVRYVRANFCFREATTIISFFWR